MEVAVFDKNVEWNLVQIAVQVGHAEKVRTRARSGYYKSAIMLAAAIVEALAYKILEKNSLMDMPLNARRKIIEKIVKQKKGKIVLTKKLVTDDIKKAKAFYN